jgi:hypothetical protein
MSVTEMGDQVLKTRQKRGRTVGCSLPNLEGQRGKMILGLGDSDLTLQANLCPGKGFVSEKDKSLC